MDSLKNEKALVKKGLEASLTLGSIWEPIVSSWFIKWKNYVNFDESGPDDREPQAIASLYPGPIDNYPLKGNFGDELRRSIVDGQDYVLLPKIVADQLFKKYTGGPKFCREVINIGSTTKPIYQVGLFPIRVEAYKCDVTHPQPSRDDPKYFSTQYFRKNCEFKNAIIGLQKIFRIHLGGLPVRYWIKEQNESEDLSQNSAENPIDLSQNPDGNDTTPTKKARKGRMLTSNVTDWDGAWKFLRKNVNVQLHDLLGEKDCIEIILETVSMKNPVDSDWPRAEALEKWKKGLRTDDMVDASDRHNAWYEAIVKEVDGTNRIHVHFKGWGAEFDEIISPNQLSTRIKPLHSVTKDRSAWEEGETVEIRVSPAGEKAIWLNAIVSTMDQAHDRVEVEYSQKAKDEVLAKYEVEKSPPPAIPTVPENPAAETPSGAALPRDEDPERSQEDGTNGSAEDKVKMWLDLYSEDLCHYHTHIDPNPKPTKPNAVTAARAGMASSLSLVLNKPNGYSSGYSSSYSYGDNHVKGTPMVAGAVGLQNLGNTCFMNSILQCLSNTQSLTELFTSDSYKDQLNFDNPLGHKGKVAQVYAKLIKDMWSGAYTKIVPREFKTTIGEFQPQFSGYDQQDSQELMGFLLDGLHEDLNRVLKKPHVTKIESKGRDDALISSESWRRYLLRNDSYLVERHFGQLKSHVTCTNCGNESVTFDEFSSLSLPLPVKNTRPVQVTAQILPLGSTPVKFQLDVEVTAPMSDLKRLVVDKLMELKLMTWEQPVKEGDSDGGFELVDLSPTEDFDEVSKDGEGNGMVGKNGTANTKSGRNYDQFHFHFGTLFGSKPTSVFKNYNAAESASTSIAAYVGRGDCLMAFQLPYKVPELRSTYTSSYSSTTTKYDPEDATSEFFAVDLCVGSKVVMSYNSYERIELFAYPTRMSFKKGMSKREVHAAVWPVLRRYVVEDDGRICDSGEEDRPYELIVSNSYASIVKSKVDLSDEPFEISATGSEILVALWRDEAKDPKHFDENQVSMIRDFSKDGVAEGPAGAKSLSITQCFDKFTEREQLADSETLYCGQCKQHLAPIKKMDIWAAPDVLILHLKRFQYVPGQYFVHREKLNDLVDFPIEELDLRNYVIGPQDEEAPPVYDLYGVSMHSGGLGGGHYTAICQNFINKKWYNFNDSIVQESDPSRAVCSTAYVLFYRRRKGSLKWAGIKPITTEISNETST